MFGEERSTLSEGSSSIAFDFPAWNFSSGAAASPNRPNSSNSSSVDATASLIADLDALSGDEANAIDEKPARQQPSPAAASDITLPWAEDLLFAVLSSEQLAASVGLLCAARAVCTLWRDVGSSSVLWRRIWEADPRFSQLQPRLPCGQQAFAAPPSRFPTFSKYAMHCRAEGAGLLRWLDLQKGWDRLEALLAPEALPLHDASPASEVAHDNGGGGGTDPSAPAAADDDVAASALAKRSGGRSSSAAALPPAAMLSAAASSPAASSPAVAAAETRRQARKLGAILASRDWQQLHTCVLMLQLECAEQLAASILAAVRLETTEGQPRLTAVETVEAAAQAAAEAEAAAAAAAERLAAADERLLVLLIDGWRCYSRWLSGVCGCFAHHSTSTCRSHLVCLLAAQRSSEAVDQHTPSLLHAGFGAFRHSVLLNKPIAAALARHLHRAKESVLAQGGFTRESGRLMQQVHHAHAHMPTLVPY